MPKDIKDDVKEGLKPVFEYGVDNSGHIHAHAAAISGQNSETGVDAELLGVSVETGEGYFHNSNIVMGKVGITNKEGDSAHIEVFAGHEGVGTHNADGSEGGHAELIASLVSVEGTLSSGGNSISAGLAIGVGAAASMGYRDQDHDGNLEGCASVSPGGFFSVGACLELPSDVSDYVKENMSPEQLSKILGETKSVDEKTEQNINKDGHQNISFSEFIDDGICVDSTPISHHHGENVDFGAMPIISDEVSMSIIETVLSDVFSDFSLDTSIGNDTVSNSEMVEDVLSSIETDTNTSESDSSNHLSDFFDIVDEHNGESNYFDSTLLDNHQNSNDEADNHISSQKVEDESDSKHVDIHENGNMIDSSQHNVSVAPTMDIDDAPPPMLLQMKRRAIMQSRAQQSGHRRGGSPFGGSGRRK